MFHLICILIFWPYLEYTDDKKFNYVWTYEWTINILLEDDLQKLRSVQQNIFEAFITDHFEAIPGDQIGLNVVDNISAKDIKRGHVASNSSDNPASRVAHFFAQVIMINHPNEVSKGYTPVIDCHTAHVACRFSEIISKMDKRTGKVIEQNPSSIKTGDAAYVKLTPMKPLCVEAFSDFAPLGRFVVRDMKQVE